MPWVYRMNFTDFLRKLLDVHISEMDFRSLGLKSDWSACQSGLALADKFSIYLYNYFPIRRACDFSLAPLPHWFENRFQCGFIKFIVFDIILSKSHHE